MVTAEQIGAAFNLGRTAGPLAFVQHAVSETWRLDTDTGSYLVKQLWPDEDPDWAYELTARMEFERRAREVAVAIAVGERQPGRRAPADLDQTIAPALTRLTGLVDRTAILLR